MPAERGVEPVGSSSPARRRRRRLERPRAFFDADASCSILVAVRRPIASLHARHARPPQNLLRAVLVPRHVPSEPRKRPPPPRGSRSRTRRSAITEGWRAAVGPSTPCPRPAPVSARRVSPPTTGGRPRRIREGDAPPAKRARRSSPPSRSPAGCSVDGEEVTRWSHSTRRLGGRRSPARARASGRLAGRGNVSGRTMYSKLSQILTTSRHGSRSAIRETASRARAAVGRCGAEQVEPARCSGGLTSPGA